MRLLFVTPSLHGGGTERGVRAWADYLSVRGHEVHVASYIRGQHDVHLRMDLSAVAWHHHDLAGASGHAGVVVALRRLLQNLTPDVVIPSLTYTNLLAVAAVRTLRRRPRILLIEHNPPARLLRSEGVSGIAKLRALRLLYGLADGVAAVSHPALADVSAAAALKGDTLFVIPNPILQRHKAERAEVSQVDILFVGRLEPQKRPDVVFAVAQQLAARGVSTTVHIVGDGSMRSELGALARDASHAVVFHGWVESWQDVARQLHTPVLLLPSRAEGFGNVLVEAAACAIACVAPASALGTGEAMIPNVTGVPAVSSRLTDLADAVLRAAVLRREDGSRGEGAVASWLDWFSTENSGRVLDDILLTLTAG